MWKIYSRTPGPESWLFKKLAVLFKSGVGRAGKTTLQREEVEQSLDVTVCSLYFHIKIRVNRCLTNTMIDSGATGNLMLESFARKHKILTQKKRNLYQLTVVDRTLFSNNQEQVTKETKNLQLCVDGTTIRSEEFNLVQIPHKVILSFLWLEKQNPRIDWKRRHLVFSRKSLVTQAEPEKVRIKEILYTEWRKYYW